MGKTNFNPNQDEPPKKPSREEVVKDTGGIVNELRKLLSDSGNPPPSQSLEEKDRMLSEPKTPSSPEELPIEDKPKEEGSLAGVPEHMINKINETPVQDQSEIEKEEPLEPSNPTPETPPAQEPTPLIGTESEPASDSDFWNGNVLGWPSDEESPATPDNAHPPAEKKEKSEESLLDKVEPLSQPDPPLVVPPSLIEKASVPESSQAEPEPEPVSSFDKKSETSVDLDSLDELISEGPQSPLSEPAEPPQKKEIDLLQPGSPAAFQASSQPEPEEVREPDIPIPIPGNIVAEKGSRRPMTNQDDDESERKKPKGVLQVACLFPKGEENRGKKFISQLKEGAARYVKPIDIQSVFIQAWEEDQIDFASWQKSAALSGADFIFLLVNKNKQTLFAETIEGLKKGLWNGRIVFVEQVNFRSLYADILIHLRQDFL